MIDTCNSLSPIFLNFKTINVLTILMNFCPVGENGVITCSSNLSYVGPNTRNSLPDNLKSATSVNSLKHYIKEYFLKKLGNFDPDIYSYT